jgi:hypothetical protein
VVRRSRHQLAETLQDLLPISGYCPGDVRLAHAVQILNTPLELVQRIRGGLPVPLNLATRLSLVFLDTS